MRQVAAAVGADQPRAVGLTMTAELSDAFRTKREGVGFVLAAAGAVFGEVPLLALTVAGELVGPEIARERPLDLAAANWVATALAVGAVEREALVLDIGSTTADIVPVAGGRPVARGRNDLDRLLAGELVYTGTLRTSLAAVAGRVPVRGGWCPVASEQFAITGDIHLILGHIDPDAYACPTPDGRPADLAHARERVARLVCSDREQLGDDEVDAIARFLHDEQVRQLEAAARRVAANVPEAPVVALGAGAFLAREVAARLERPVASPSAAWERAEGGPAAALAGLVASRLGGQSCRLADVGGGYQSE